MDIAHKKAVTLKRNATTWVLGGTWSARGRIARRSNWTSVAREEGFDPKLTSNAWLNEESQVGWFVHDKRPASALPLAAAVARRVSQDDHPWLGVFRLSDDGWWYIALDNTGAVHPRWDIWVPEDDRSQFENDHAAELGALPEAMVVDNPEDAWLWIMDGVDLRSIQPARPVLSAKYRLRRLAILGTFGLTALIGGHFALRYWHHQQMEKSLARIRELARERAEKIAAARKAAAAERNGMSERIQNYLAHIARPWKHQPTWNMLYTSCDKDAQKSYDEGYKYGWRLERVTCTNTGHSIQYDVKWKQGKFATLFHKPHGYYSPSGRHVMSINDAPLNGGVNYDAAVSGDLTKLWIAYAQKWVNIFLIDNSNKWVSYQPPIPSFMGKRNPKQKNDMPILWRSKRIRIASSIGIGKEPFFFSVKGFVPKSIEMDFGNTTKTTFTGVQYEKQ